MCNKEFFSKYTLARHNETSKSCNSTRIFINESKENHEKEMKELKETHNKEIEQYKEKNLKLEEMIGKLNLTIQENKRKFNEKLKLVEGEVAKEYNEKLLNLNQKQSETMAKNMKGTTNYNTINIAIEPFRYVEYVDVTDDMKAVGDILEKHGLAKGCLELFKRYYKKVPPNILIQDYARNKMTVYTEEGWKQEPFGKFINKIANNLKDIVEQCIPFKLEELRVRKDNARSEIEERKIQRIIEQFEEYELRFDDPDKYPIFVSFQEMLNHKNNIEAFKTIIKNMDEKNLRPRIKKINEETEEETTK
jgi:hypothetical protein